MTKERIQGSEIPLPLDKVILLDLDKTLIDGKYQITDAKIHDEVKRVQSLGWQLGLSSDTPLKALIKWQEEFGFKGPIVAERGSIILLPNGTELNMFPAAEAHFSNLKSRLIAHLTNSGTPFYVGDCVQFIRNDPKLQNLVDSRLVLVNAYWKNSMSFYGRDIDTNGKLQINSNSVDELVSLLKQGEPATFKVREDVNPDYGICILSVDQANKRDATMRLMSELGLHKIGMIGDSGTDIIGSDIAIHYAVGNAKEVLKETADFVATSNYTSGVVEILSHIK